MLTWIENWAKTYEGWLKSSLADQDTHVDVTKQLVRRTGVYDTPPFQ